MIFTLCSVNIYIQSLWDVLSFFSFPHFLFWKHCLSHCMNKINLEKQSLFCWKIDDILLIFTVFWELRLQHFYTTGSAIWNINLKALLIKFKLLNECLCLENIKQSNLMNKPCVYETSLSSRVTVTVDFFFNIYLKGREMFPCCFTLLMTAVPRAGGSQEPGTPFWSSVSGQGPGTWTICVFPGTLTELDWTQSTHRMLTA